MENDIEIIPHGSIVIQEGDSLRLYVTSSHVVAFYSWKPDSLFPCSDCESPVVKPTETSLITLNATDINNCTWDDSLLVKVEDRLAIPNAFSPNGDGINDIFLIAGNFYSLAFMKIFDRWGELIFETQDPSIGWDGTFKGKSLNPDVFVYMIQYKEGNVAKMKKGSVTLIR